MQAHLLIDSSASLVFPINMKNRVGERLRAIMAERELTQTAAADLCGLSVARFHNYVSGYRMPDLDTLMRIAKAFGTTTDYLLGFSFEPPDLAEVVRRLLELEGMDAIRADVVAATVQEALALLLALPDEGDARTRSRIAAQAAWQLRGGPKPLQ